MIVPYRDDAGLMSSRRAIVLDADETLAFAEVQVRRLAERARLS